MLNDVPMEYFSALDSEGVRLDIANRPELHGGSVDYVAPKEYMVNHFLSSSLRHQNQFEKLPEKGFLPYRAQLVQHL